MLFVSLFAKPLCHRRSLLTDAGCTHTPSS